MSLVGGILARVTNTSRLGGSRIPFTGRTISSVHVNEDNIVTISSAWACLRYLTQATGMLSWHAYRDQDTGPTIASGHPVDWLLWKRVNKEWSSFQFRETLLHWALRYGNGYAEIEPDQAGRPFAMWPVHPDYVNVCRAKEDGLDIYGDPIAKNDIYYDVRLGDVGERVPLSSMRMFHLRGFGNDPVGINVVQYAAESLGWVKAVQLFGASFFGNGTNISAVVLNKRPLSEKGLKKQKAEMADLYGGVRKAHKTAHLDADADIKFLGLDAQKSQLIEANQALISEVCRWFGVPPHKVMDLLRATFSNVEHQAIEAVVDSIQPWVKRFEDEADWKLFGQQNRQNFYTKINMRALMRGDSAARIEFYRGMFDMGAYSPNRILELEDENTLGADGDKHLVQLNLTTLENAGEQPEPAVTPTADAAGGGSGDQGKPPTNQGADDQAAPPDRSATQAMGNFFNLIPEAAHMPESANV